MDDKTSVTPIRVGVLGNSDIARRKFIPALLQSSLAKLVAIGTGRPDKVTLPASISPSLLMTYQELLDHPDIDLVYISLPNHLHEEWSISALDRGKHVMCEKPLALSAAAASRMFETADRHGRLLYENLMYLQHPLHAAVKATITAGCIGEILSLESEFAIPGPAPGDVRLDPAAGGGAFHDLNRYPLSAALHFLKGRRHRILSGSVMAQGGLNLAMTAETVTDAGERFTFTVAFNRPYRSYYKICGKQGTIRVDRAFTTPPDMAARVEVCADGIDRSFSVAPCDHFLTTIEHVCRLIRSGDWASIHERSHRVAAFAEQVMTHCREGVHVSRN